MAIIFGYRHKNLHLGIAHHWHPNEDYCIKCGKHLNSPCEILLVPCKCAVSDEVHAVYQRIHYKCLEEVKDKISVEEIYNHLGIELPIT